MKFTSIQTTWGGVQKSECTNLSKNWYCNISLAAISSRITAKIRTNVFTVYINLAKKYGGDVIQNASVG